MDTKPGKLSPKTLGPGTASTVMLIWMLSVKWLVKALAAASQEALAAAAFGAEIRAEVGRKSGRDDQKAPPLGDTHIALTAPFATLLQPARGWPGALRQAHSSSWLTIRACERKNTQCRPFINHLFRSRSLVLVALWASRPRARLGAGLVVVERPRWRSLVSVALWASRSRACLGAGLVVVERRRWRSLVSVVLWASRPRACLGAGLVVVERPRWRSPVLFAFQTSRLQAVSVLDWLWPRTCRRLVYP